MSQTCVMSLMSSLGTVLLLVIGLSLTIRTILCLFAGMVDSTFSPLGLSRLTRVSFLFRYQNLTLGLLVRLYRYGIVVLSCAQARKSIGQGCRSFLVLVTQAEFAHAALAAADVRESVASSSPATAQASADLEQANLLQHVDALLQQYSDVFAEPSGPPPDRWVEHVIPLLPDSQPPFQRRYRLAPSELPEVQRQVVDLLAKQLIEPSTSPSGAPILFVEKKTGNLRMVVDYRALDKIKVKSRYPLPQTNDLLNKLFGAVLLLPRCSIWVPSDAA